MNPRFVYQKWYLYPFLSVLLYGEGKVAAQQTRDVNESYDKLITINFAKIKKPRLIGKKLKKHYLILGNILKGMMVPVGEEDVKWVKKNFRYRKRLKGDKKKGHSISAYYLAKKLHYCDEESFFPIREKNNWPPKLLIAFSKTIENDFRTDKFKELVRKFDLEDALKQVMGDYYDDYYNTSFYEEEEEEEGGEEEEEIPQPLKHCREETENNWQILIDNPEDFIDDLDEFEGWEEPNENKEVSILIRKPSSDGNTYPKVFISSLVIIPTAIFYEKRRQKMKKTSSTAR